MLPCQINEGCNEVKLGKDWESIIGFNNLEVIGDLDNNSFPRVAEAGESQMGVDSREENEQEEEKLETANGDKVFKDLQKRKDKIGREAVEREVRLRN